MASRLYTSVNFNSDDSNEIEKYECSICLDIMYQPYMVIECGHMYCKECIMNQINGFDKRCPLCKINIDSKDIIPNKWIETHVINSLMYMCHNVGCNTKCEVGKDCRNIIDHNTKCEYIYILCDCGDNIQRKDLEEHQKTNKCLTIINEILFKNNNEFAIEIEVKELEIKNLRLQLNKMVQIKRCIKILASAEQNRNVEFKKCISEILLMLNLHQQI